jgi:hypothetical protein
MALRIKPLSESEFTRQVIRLAQLRGYLVAHFRPGMTRRGKWVTAVSGDGVGFPDLLLIRIRHGVAKVIVAELKLGRNKLTPEQESWLCAFRLAGIQAYLWRPENWPEIEKLLEV